MITGRPSSNGVKTEILDISNPSMSCLLDDTTYRYGSQGGLLGSTPVICGGHDGSGSANGTGTGRECLLYGTSQMITMNIDREFYSSVMLDNSMIWLIGGHSWTAWGLLDSTEFVTKDGAVSGPILPETSFAACAIKFDSNGYVYLISGGPDSGPTDNVWISNPLDEFAFIQGPSVISARRFCGCATMSIGAKKIIIAAGGKFGSYNYLSSVEVLDPLTNNIWVAGK